MDCSKTINFFSELKRLCDSRDDCEADVANKERCPLYGFCRQSLTIRAEEIITAIENLQKWSDKHPKKTYAQDFFEKFPKAQKSESEKRKCPMACRRVIYGGECPNIECDECWNELMEE